MGKSRGGETMARPFYTEEDALVAVEEGLSLNDVPDGFKTPDVCLAPVKKSGGSNFRYVPGALKTPEFRRAAEVQID
jgi:hypothetical protein